MLARSEPMDPTLSAPGTGIDNVILSGTQTSQSSRWPRPRRVIYRGAEMGGSSAGTRSYMGRVENIINNTPESVSVL